MSFAVVVVVGMMLFLYSSMLSSSSSSIQQSPAIVSGSTTPPRREKAATAQPPVEAAESSDPAVWSYEIKHEYPHDPRAYLQGLEYHDGKLYESTGLYGETTVRQVELTTGKVLKSTPLGTEHFGEGLTVYKVTLHRPPCMRPS
jgi:hypothetical protein